MKLIGNERWAKLHPDSWALCVGSYGFEPFDIRVAGWFRVEFRYEELFKETSASGVRGHPSNGEPYGFGSGKRETPSTKHIPPGGNGYRTPLMLAAAHQHLDVFNLLLDRGADPNLRDVSALPQNLNPMRPRVVACGGAGED